MNRKLEIGPGNCPIGTADEGWETVAFEVQWGEKPLPFSDNTFTEVYASHVLEHIPWYNTIIALRQVYRILQPGGMAEFWVPDFAVIVKAYQEKRCGDKWRRKNQDGYYMNWVQGRLFTYGPGADNWHHACFDAEHLTHSMREAGFQRVEIIPKRTRGTAHGLIDLGVRGYK